MADDPARSVQEDGQAGARGRVERLASRARLALGWERAWPPLAFALAILAAFVALALLGAFDLAGGAARPAAAL
ncbi:MAG: hypothetical protein KGQ28_09960, partial [Hyphomicrobiales bacterium]|nr:hypothetical protein [Hyphomicrobiales bacterium]